MRISLEKWRCEYRVNTLHFCRLVFLFLSVLLPSSLLFPPVFLLRLLKGNERTHPLSFISSDAGLCLLVGLLPVPDRQKRKWIEIKTPTPSFHLLTTSLWSEESYPGSNVKSDMRRIVCNKHLQKLLLMVGGHKEVTVVFTVTSEWMMSGKWVYTCAHLVVFLMRGLECCD